MGLFENGLLSRDFTWLYDGAMEKAMAPHSSTLAWRIPWMEEPSGLPSVGSHRVGHDWSDLAAAAAVLHRLQMRPGRNHYCLVFSVGFGILAGFLGFSCFWSTPHGEQPCTHVPQWVLSPFSCQPPMGDSCCLLPTYPGPASVLGGSYVLWILE